MSIINLLDQEVINYLINPVIWNNHTNITCYKYGSTLCYDFAKALIHISRDCKGRLLKEDMHVVSNLETSTGLGTMLDKSEQNHDCEQAKICGLPKIALGLNFSINENIPKHTVLILHKDNTQENFNYKTGYLFTGIGKEIVGEEKYGGDEDFIEYCPCGK